MRFIPYLIRTAYRLFLFSLFAFWGWSTLYAQTVRLETFEQKQERMRWWREGRIGLFIHYGPVSQTGKEISWSRGKQTPVEVYDNLYKTFNPVQFNGDEWAGIAKDMGAKYVVLTVKHCDGFLLWNSQVDNYNIMATPFHRDLARELADAVRKAGLHMGWYYSPMDWRDVNCRSKTGNDIFVTQKLQPELRELLSNYGKIDIIWFDSDGHAALWHPQETTKLVFALQPQILINNRLEMSSVSEWRNQGKLRDYEDFYTPEQKVVEAYDSEKPWESCMTLGTQWSWKPDDKIKTAQETVAILAKTVGGDGNLLLDVGPMPDGRIEPRQVAVLHELGDWLRANGSSVYATRGGPYLPGKNYASTRSGNFVFLHLLANQTMWTLPPFSGHIIRAQVGTGDGGPAVTFKSTAQSLNLQLPSNPTNFSGDTVVRLTLDSDAMSLPVIPVASIQK